MAIKTKKVTTKKLTADTEVAAANFSQTNQDLMISILIVSLTVNLFILIGWVALQVTSVYDAEVAAFLFTK